MATQRETTGRSTRKTGPLDGSPDGQDEVAREALDELSTDDEIEAARMLVRHKMRSVRGLEQDKAVRRLVGMLARKGHSPGVAFRVVREELEVDLADPEHQPG